MPIALPAGSEIRPMDAQMLCRMYAHTGKTSDTSRIYIPDIAGARPEAFFAQVLKVGPGKPYDINLDTMHVNRFPMQYKPGDDVVFLRYHGERTVIDHQIYIILSSDDVLAVVELPEESKDKFFVWAKDGDFEGNEGNALDAAQVNV